MKSIKLIKYKGVLYWNKRVKNTNHLKITKHYLGYNNILKSSQFKLDSIKSYLINFESIVKSVQLHAPKINKLMNDAIIKVNRVLNESLKVQLNLINNITTNIDFSKLQEMIDLLEESLKQFIKYSEIHRLSMKLEYFSDYYDIYLEKHKITEEDIYITFKSHYSSIKNNLIENNFYYPANYY